MNNRFTKIVLFLITLAFVFNSINVYAENVNKLVLKKQRTPIQKVNNNKKNAEQLSISQLQNDIRVLKKLAISVNRSINNNQIQQSNQMAQELQRKAKQFENRWTLTRKKAKFIGITKKNQLKLADIKTDLKVLVKFTLVEMPESDSGTQSITIEDCAKNINVSPNCTQNCCDQNACLNCCENLQNSGTIDLIDQAKIAGCPAKCLFKASMCLLQGVADRQSDNVRTLIGT